MFKLSLIHLDVELVIHFHCKKAENLLVLADCSQKRLLGGEDSFQKVGHLR